MPLHPGLLGPPHPGHSWLHRTLQQCSSPNRRMLRASPNAPVRGRKWRTTPRTGAPPGLRVSGDTSMIPAVPAQAGAMAPRPHFRFWPKRVPHSIAVPATSLWHNLAIRALRYPDKTAPVFSEPLPHTAGPQDLAILPHTSGTTGQPKGCMHTHASIMHQAASLVAIGGAAPVRALRSALCRRLHDLTFFVRDGGAIAFQSAGGPQAAVSGQYRT